MNYKIEVYQYVPEEKLLHDIRVSSLYDPTVDLKFKLNVIKDLPFSTTLTYLKYSLIDKTGA